MGEAATGNGADWCRVPDGRVGTGGGDRQGLGTVPADIGCHQGSATLLDSQLRGVERVVGSPF